MTAPGGDSRSAQFPPAAGPPTGGPPSATPPSEASRLLDTVLAEAARHRRADLQARLARERGRLETSTCLVAVVGEFKKGKGTLINALLDMRVCGTDPVATTLVPTLVRYAPRATATLRRAAPASDGSADSAAPPSTRPTDEPVTITALHEVAQAAAAEGRGASITTVTGTEIGIPRRLLESGLLLLDTPGLNGGLADGRATATLRAAAGADAVVFVSDASQELTAPELELLRRLVRLCPAVVLALAKVDVYPHWRRIRDTNLAHLRRSRLELPIFPLAAPLRHHALRAGRSDLDGESGYPALAALLRDEIVGGRRARLEKIAAEAATDALGQMLAELETERATLADPAAARELRAKLEEAEQRAKGMSEAAATWRRVLGDRSQDMTARVRDDLDNRLRNLESAVARRIETSEPARDWDDLRGWLYRQTNDALLTHRMMIRSEAEALVTAVTREFEADSERVRALLDAATGLPLGTITEGHDPEFQRVGGVDLLAQGARGGGIGLMIVSVGGTVASLAGFAAASVLLAPVGIGVVVVLGRRTIASIRENEVRVHRANALKTAREYLAETRRVAAQDSATAREQIYRNLRDTLTEQAAELSTSAQRNKEASARSIKATWESRRARLAAVEAEVSRLRSLVGTAGAAGTGVAP